MIRNLVLSGIASGALVAQAQTVDLKGRVLDKANNKPIPGATVKVANSTLSVTTDTAGRFVLKGNPTDIIRGGRGSVSGRVWLAAPRFKDGFLHVEAAQRGQEAHVELFGLGGETLSSVHHPLAEGWNRLQVLPDSQRDFLGFARVTVAGESWMERILAVNGRVLNGNGGGATPARLAKPSSSPSAAGNVEVSMAKLLTKTVAFSNDVQDLGDIMLDYPERKLDVGAPPIYGASILWDGSKGRAAAQAELLAKWQDWPRFTPSDIKFKLAKDPDFPNDTNKVTIQSCCNTLWGYDDIQAKEVHGDAQLHVEWIAMGRYDETENPDIGPSGKGQNGYVNSGVYIQSRYEVQIESQGTSDAKHDMASLVDDYAPTTWAPNRPNGKWQAYDITFRSARYNAQGQRTENARITVWWNGVIVHDNRDARAPATGTSPGTHSGEDLTPILYGLKLQSEGRDVRFRNIWIKHLDIKDPQTKFGY
jgi:hypothetical protein